MFPASYSLLAFLQSLGEQPQVLGATRWGVLHPPEKDREQGCCPWEGAVDLSPCSFGPHVHHSPAGMKGLLTGQLLRVMK